MDKSSMPIGVFDSGVGGISVLREALRALPGEDFIYYGDTAHAPYGTKSEDQVCRLACRVVDTLLTYQIKALVIACNTATGAAGQMLRSTYDMPIIGMEPALKPASLIRQQGQVLVLATPVTLTSQKYQRLYAQYGEGAVSLPCPGLMEFVERGDEGSPELLRYLQTLFAPFDRQAVDAVVLGCTHYVFLKDVIAPFFDAHTRVIDGNAGTVQQLKRRLMGAELLFLGKRQGQVTLLSSDEGRSLPLMQKLLIKP